MFSSTLTQEAEAFVRRCREQAIRVALAESCTGGLLAALLTEIPGSSDIFDRGFVVYSNAAKTAMLQVSEAALTEHGAVSETVAIQMAEGAMRQSSAQLTAGITGIAGPGGGSTEKPVGLVHLATAMAGKPTLHEMPVFNGNRGEIRMQAVLQTLRLMAKQLEN